jgi:hypothetical protein
MDPLPAFPVVGSFEELEIRGKVVSEANKQLPVGGKCEKWTCYRIQEQRRAVTFPDSPLQVFELRFKGTLADNVLDGKSGVSSRQLRHCERIGGHIDLIGGLTSKILGFVRKEGRALGRKQHSRKRPGFTILQSPVSQLNLFERVRVPPR